MDPFYFPGNRIKLVRNKNVGPPNLSPDPDDHIEMTKTSPDQKIETITDKLDDGLPNRLLSAIPISDLGESLDSRHLSESFNGALGKMKSEFFFPPSIKPFDQNM